MTDSSDQDPTTETQTPDTGVQVPRTAVYAEHVDPSCPVYGETVRWPVDSVNGVWASVGLRCDSCFRGEVELRRVSAP